MAAKNAKMVRVGNAHLEAAHAHCEQYLGERVRDRQAIEYCIAGLTNMDRLIAERSRAMVAVNTLNAVRTITGLQVQLRYAPEQSNWWIVAPGENTGGYPVGQVSKKEMDRALNAAGLEGMHPLN